MSAEYRKILDDLRKFEHVIPKIVSEMGAIAQSHFIKSFRNQGFTDNHLDKWQPRERNSYRTRSGKLVDDTTRAILVGKGTGNLRRLRKLQVSRFAVEIVSNAATDKYARVHNEGLRAGRGRGFKMPKRQFVGYSHVMNARIVRMINRYVKQSIKAAA